MQCIRVDAMRRMHAIVWVTMVVVAVVGASAVLDDEYAEMVEKRHQMLRDGFHPRYGPWDLFREAWPCPSTRRYGTNADGGKWTCYVPHNCTVLSIGIENEVSFETELATVHACMVYAYDPTVPRFPILHDRVRFHKTGVRGDSRHPLASTVHGGMSIKEMLAENSLDRVDIFKVDVEEAEFGMLEELFIDYPSPETLPFDQLLIEFHVMEHSTDELVRAIEKLEEYGFRLFETEINPSNPRCCAELAFVHRTAFVHEFPLSHHPPRHGTWIPP
jgi:hypothetical protein